MKKIRNLVIGGIEQKVFNLILITVIVITIAFMAVMTYQNKMLSRLSAETSERQQQSITEINDQVMDQVVRSSMDRTTYLESVIADELFHGFDIRVEMLAEYAQKLFSDPDGNPQAAFAAPDPLRNGEITAQTILAEGVDPSDPLLVSRLGTAANMSDMMISMFDASDVTNSCFIALPEGAFLVTDDRSGSKFDSQSNAVPYDPRTRPWYIQAVETGGLIFTDVEVDAFTGDIGVVCAMPVYVDGRLEAVVGSDLFLTSMRDAIEASDENGGFLCVVNQQGHVVFSPRTEGPFRVLSGKEADSLLSSDNPELAGLVGESLRGRTEVRLITMEDGEYYMAGAPMKTVGWALISVFGRDALSRPAEMMHEGNQRIQREAVTAYRDSSAKFRRSTMILLIGLLVLLGSAALILGKRIVKPLNTIIRRISQLNEGNLEFKMEDTYRTGDEIQVLAESFADLSHKTVQYVDQVRTVTAEKERIGTELHMAYQIQESMLPNIFPAFPDRPEFDIYATMEPAREVGGDFYDFFLIDPDHLCIVMADVSGKGVPAALFMMASKIILQSCAMLGRSAGEILTKTNEALCSNNKMQMFVTVWLGVLEISTGKMTCANAGHEYPCLLHRNETFELVRGRHGFVIGGLENVKYQEHTLQLQPGDKLYLYTDGVPEATNDRQEAFGTGRLTDALNRDPGAGPEAILENVHSAVQAFVGGAEQFDDMTMLCLEYKGAVNSRES